MDQIIIKTVLIIAFVLFAVMLLRAGGSARSQAIRTIGLLIFVLAACLMVLFPSIVNDLALSVGVGRGADLLLYAFIIVFVGQSLSTARKRREQDTQITELARKIALSDPLSPREKHDS